MLSSVGVHLHTNASDAYRFFEPSGAFSLPFLMKCKAWKGNPIALDNGLLE
jgi:hypothetical protein